MIRRIRDDDYDYDFQSEKQSVVEINRIPSLKRTKYSVSTIATQADMEKGSILAERKDYKYRNQEMSDVESQILSIEVDLGSETAYNNSDWYGNNESLRRFGAPSSNPYSNNNQICVLQPLSSKLSSLTNSFKDRFVAARRKDCGASVTVNDYSAFKNCLNFQLQAARAANLEATTHTETQPNYALEIRDSTNQAEPKKSAFTKTISTFRPLTQHQSQQPVRNRMIVRISSVSSTRSASVKRILTEETLHQKITTTTQTTTMQNSQCEQKSASTLASSSSLLPHSSSSSSTKSQDSSPLKKSAQPFFSLDSATAMRTSDQQTPSADTEKNIPPMIYEAYQAAVSSSSLSHSVPQFPNSLYMYLDAIPYFRSCLQDGLFSTEDYQDCKAKLVNSASKLKTVPPPPPPPPPPQDPPVVAATNKLRLSCSGLDANDESVDSSKLEESFNKCYEANLFRKNKSKPSTEYRVHENEISDPNTIYSQVESDDTGKSVTSSEDASSVSSYASSVDKATRKKELNNKPTNNQSSSTSSVEKELASFNLTPSVGFSQRFSEDKTSKAERLKKMLAEEREALNLARKEPHIMEDENKYSVESPRKLNRVVTKTPSVSFSKLNGKVASIGDKPAQIISNFFKMNKKSDTLHIQQQQKGDTNEVLDDQEEDGDSVSTSSSVAAQKNVRFSDNVSYI